MPLSELMDFDAFLSLKGMHCHFLTCPSHALATWHILLGTDEVFVQATEQEFRSHCRGWGILGKNDLVILPSSLPGTMTRWWQLKYFLCSPRSLKKWSNLTNIFQMAWNRQLDEHHDHSQSWFPRLVCIVIHTLQLPLNWLLDFGAMAGTRWLTNSIRLHLPSSIPTKK